MKNKELLEVSLMGAVTEYAHSQDDKNFNVVVEVSCKDGVADANVIENDVVDGFVMSAIKTICNTENPEKFAEHNQTAIRIARTAAALALQQKGGDNA